MKIFKFLYHSYLVDYSFRTLCIFIKKKQSKLNSKKQQPSVTSPLVSPNIFVVNHVADQAHFSTCHIPHQSIECRRRRLDILFCQITTFIKFCVAFVFGLQTLLLIAFSKIYQFKGLKPKNKGHTNFYEHCGLTKNFIQSTAYWLLAQTDRQTYLCTKQHQCHNLICF